MSLRTLRDLHQALRAVVPGLAPWRTTGASLEASALPQEPPRTRACRVLEDAVMSAHLIDGAPVVAFAAFLDGTQESHAVWPPAGGRGVPIVWARTAAVIRRRVSRRLVTWGAGPLVAHRLYVPRIWLEPDLWDRLRSSGVPVVDTLEGLQADAPVHPQELLRRAVHRVQADRETLERELAERWCAEEGSPLFIDGGLPLGDQASQSPWCVGVVKSHHTIYTDAQGLPAVLGLPAGARTSIFAVERTWGPGALSWYLRLRGPSAHDPLTGLVRVEVTPVGRDGSAAALGAHADLVSRWILAERNPVALPDGRWDRMVYGIRDCEEYLRAIS